MLMIGYQVLDLMKHIQNAKDLTTKITGSESDDNIVQPEL